MILILNLAMPFFALVVIGLIAARIFKVDADGLAWLNIFIVYFALPAMIFMAIAAAPFEKLIEWPFVLSTSLATYLAYLTAFLTSVLVLRNRITTAAIHGTSASFGNVGYMGLPLSVAFFGPEAAVPAALIMSFDNTLQFTLTPLLASLGANEEANRRNNWRVSVEIFYKIIKHPFIIATILGVLVSAFKIELPLFIDNFMSILSKAAGPCALFALGVTLGKRRFQGIGREFPLIVTVKLLLQPLFVFGTLSLMGNVDPTWLHVALMMAALPSATNAFILATQFNRYVEGASSVVLVTTLLSALTVPVIVYMAKNNMIPSM